MSVETVTLPLNGPVYSADRSELWEGVSAELHDSFVNRLGHTCKRPALVPFLDLGLTSPVDGLFWWDVKGLMMVACGGRLFKLSGNGLISHDLTSATLLGGRRPSFTSDGTVLLVANGGKILTTDGTATTAYLADGDAPTAVNHLGFIDAFIVADVAGSDKFQYCEVGNYASWRQVDFDVAMTQPDESIALFVKNRRVTIFGKETAETWMVDGIGPFGRVDQLCFEHGFIAPHSFIYHYGTWYGLDSYKRVVKMDGGIPVPISAPIDGTLSQLAEVRDAKGDLISFEGTDFYVLHLPTASRTFIYNLTTQQWDGEWHNWDSVRAEYQSWLGNCYAYSPAWNLHLVGSRLTGKLYRLAPGAFDDNGTPIRSARTTGMLSHGTTKSKISTELRLYFRRGAVAAGATTPEVMIRFRDNGSSKWSNEYRRSLGGVGETSPLVRFISLGEYEQREYEIVTTAAAPYILIGGQEDIEICK